MLKTPQKRQSPLNTSRDHQTLSHSKNQSSGPRGLKLNIIGFSFKRISRRSPHCGTVLNVGALLKKQHQTQKIKALGLLVLDKRILKKVLFMSLSRHYNASYINLCCLRTPQTGPVQNPRNIIKTPFVESHLVISHTKY